MKFLFLIIAMTALLPLTRAGNGSSGGGNIYGDSINPWFFQNTKVVNYCIDLGPDFSSLSIEEIRPLINETFDYWKAQFKTNANYQYSGDQQPGYYNPAPQVATQKFVEVNCSEKNIDLRFQLGILTDSQKAKISNLGQIIGLAYRESYDEVNLKGKGFIYIAAEKGEYRPDSEQFSKRAWSHGKNKVLLATLTHEVGHIFGLQDLPVIGPTLMGRHFAEWMTTDQAVIGLGSKWDFSYAKPLGFDGKNNSEMIFDISGPMSKTLCEFLGLHLYEASCSMKKFVILGKGEKTYFYYLRDDSTKVHVGTFDLSTGNKVSMDEILTSNVWLTKKQKIFKTPSDYYLNSPSMLFNFHWSGFISNVKYKTTLGAIQREVYFSFSSPEEFRIGAVIKGKFYQDITDADI